MGGGPPGDCLVGQSEELGGVDGLDSGRRQLRRRRHGRVLGEVMERLPNTRVQRTRSSASPPHSPLTRRRLGRSKRIWLYGSLVGLWGLTLVSPAGAQENGSLPDMLPSGVLRIDHGTWQ